MKNGTQKKAGSPLSSSTPHVEATYDRVATHYDDAMRPLERLFLAHLRSETLAHLASAQYLIEIGAGTGLNFPFYPRDARGVATELSGGMIEVAQEKTTRPAGVHLVQSCAEQIPFADATFDAALATLVFCSVRSPQKSFAELRRVVRPGGIIALLEHVRPENVLGPVFDALNLLTSTLFDDHFNRRTAEEARRAGLQTISVERKYLGIIQRIICRV